MLWSHTLRSLHSATREATVGRTLSTAIRGEPPLDKMEKARAALETWISLNKDFKDTRVWFTAWGEEGLVVYIHGLFPLGPCVAKGDHGYIRVGCVCDWNLLQQTEFVPPAPLWAAVHGVAQSRTRLKRLSMHACIGEGNGNPLQYSCLENPRDGGAWWASVFGVAQSRTRLKRLSNSSPAPKFIYWNIPM